jgi:integrase
MPPRTQNKLTDLQVRKAKAAGWYGDGGGLYLRIDSAGAKRWIFVFQWQAKRAEMGLGSVAEVGLGEARDARDEAKKVLRSGKNPIEERRLERERTLAAAEVKVLTFAEWATEIAPAIAPRSKKVRKTWLSQMTKHVGRLAAKPPAQVTTDDVLASLKPYWVSRPETADKLRRRIESVLDAAKAKGHIPDPTWQNPARWRGHLDKLLERRARKVKHFAALPYKDAPAFMVRLRQMERMAAAALEFTILTVVRNQEGRAARRGELDREGMVWIIPAERMKGVLEAKREHRVPLNDAMLAVLDRVWPDGWPEDPAALMFPSSMKLKRPKDAPNGWIMSENTLQKVVNDLGLKGVATVHGFRSTFKDWATDCTTFANEVSEEALAHLVGDDTERAYRRTDRLAKRRKLMEAWAGYLARGRASGDNVTELRRVGGR